MRCNSGIVHADFNEDNIFLVKSAVEDEWKISGLIDFGDSMRMCYLYDLAIIIMQLMSTSQNLVPLLDVGGHILAGYLESSRLTPSELACLRLCVAARYAQSLVIGRWAYMQSPTADNQYVLNTQKDGWDQLRTFWEISPEKLYRKWASVID